jgi:hypothetical protein
MTPWTFSNLPIFINTNIIYICQQQVCWWWMFFHSPISVLNSSQTHLCYMLSLSFLNNETLFLKYLFLKYQLNHPRIATVFSVKVVTFFWCLSLNPWIWPWTLVDLELPISNLALLSLLLIIHLLTRTKCCQWICLPWSVSFQFWSSHYYTNKPNKLLLEFSNGVAIIHWKYWALRELSILHREVFHNPI